MSKIERLSIKLDYLNSLLDDKIKEYQSHVKNRKLVKAYKASLKMDELKAEIEDVTTSLVSAKIQMRVGAKS